jgi:hypothetical protein
LGNKAVNDYLLPALTSGLLGFASGNTSMDSLPSSRRRKAVRVLYALDILLVELSKRAARAVLKDDPESFAIIVPHLVRIISRQPIGALEDALKAAVRNWTLEMRLPKASTQANPFGRI